ncbi:phosphoribosyl-AMP cyclohydrolase [uncultured Aliiroseovarius sp.]|uniref:phosphoribosyl-AMP cyclohydrolase n=1 Tax=uncultured Aliiroseovarius sp. TaxID=1658783 RepID=UPI002633B0FA|nr:phosphoribosyl-AMP cyclohydrolase [uncultured Aliiroseovarius sp.]
MITEDDLLAARTAWGNALIAISKAYEENGIEAARTLATQTLDAAYGYNMGPVLFKPTLSGGAQTFRTTQQGALSYFVGHDDTYPQDGGFALRNWREVRFETAASFINGNVGMWMGWAYFTDKDGNTTKADKTFGYQKDTEGTLRVVVHHSSLPFEG